MGIIYKGHISIKDWKFGVKLWARKVIIQAGFLSNLKGNVNNHVIYIDCDIDNANLYRAFRHRVNDVMDNYYLALGYIIETDPKGRYYFVSPCVVDWPLLLKIHIDFIPFSDQNHLRAGLEFGRMAIRLTEKDNKKLKLRDIIYKEGWLNPVIPYHKLNNDLMKALEQKFYFKHDYRKLSEDLDLNDWLDLSPLNLTVYETFGV